MSDEPALVAVDKKPVNLLSLDGGGIRGVSELVILDEIMKRVQHDMQLEELPRPCDYFDLIGGTSTGGLIAIMLGRLRMTTKEALEQYNRIAGRVFASSNKKKPYQDGTFKATTLEIEMKAVIAATIRNGVGNERMLDSDSKGFTFVCAVPSVNLAYPRRFRTYKVRINSNPNCTIWEAARATTAAPTIFKGITIGEEGQIPERFIDGGIKCNNPVKEVVDEAMLVFGGDRPFGVLVSIGTGHPGVIGFSAPDAIQSMLPTKLITTLKNLATDCESTADEMKRQWKNVPNRYFRFNVTHGAGEIPMEEWKKMGDVQAHTKAYLQQSEVSDAIDLVVRHLCRMVGEESVLPLGAAFGRAKEIWNMRPKGYYKPLPTASNFFTGRKDYLKRLQDHFSPRITGIKPRRRTFLLYGLGGGGKTQICAKFIEENSHLFWGIFWIDASSADTLNQTVRDIAASPDAKLHEVQDSSDAVIRWLSDIEDEWLMVFDNADGDPDLLSDFIPSGNRGNIIFTSRNPALRRLAPQAFEEVQCIDEADAITLLLKTAFLDTSCANFRLVALSIVTELCCLPLAVDQAGSAIASGLCTIDGYLQMYTSHRQYMMDLPSFKAASKYGRAVYSTWDLSFLAVQSRASASGGSSSAKAEAYQSAITTLQTFAFFHHEGITEEIFDRAAHSHRLWQPTDLDSVQVESIQFPQLLQCNGEIWDRLLFREGIQILLSFSLIQQPTLAESYSVHPLVHQWSRDRLSSQSRLLRYRGSGNLLSSSVTFQNNHSDHVFHRKLVPHIMAHLRYLDSSEIDRSNCCPDGDLGRFAFVLSGNGLLKQTAYLEALVVESGKRVFGLEHPKTLSAMSNLALSHRKLGRYSESEELQTQVLELRRKVLGVEDPDTLMSMNNLSVVYSHTGRLQESEQLQKQVLEIRTRVLGIEDPDTLGSMNNLARVYAESGRLQESEQLQTQVLKAQMQVLGVEHPNTLLSMNNLALLYSDLGRRQESERLLAQTLEALMRVLGAEHPETLACMNNQACLYSDMGRHQEAEKLHRLVLDHQIRVLGPDHPETRSSMNNLCLVYNHQERYGEEEQLRKQLLDSQRRVLGVEHIDTVGSMSSLAEAYLGLKQYQESEELLVQVLEIRTRVLGAEHADTLTSMHLLAMVYSHLNRHQEAEQLQIQVLEMRKRVLGTENSNTLVSMFNLAQSHRSLGHHCESEQLLVQGTEIARRVLKADDPITMNFVEILASLYLELGRYCESEPLFSEVLGIRRKVFGAEHPNTLNCINGLATVYYHLKQHQEGERFGKELLEAAKRVHGAEHPNTLIGMDNMASTYSELQRHGEAEQLQRQLLEIQMRVLGAEHPRSLTTMGKLVRTVMQLGQYQEAERLQKQLVDVQTKVYGGEDPSTLVCVQNLAVIYGYLERHKESEQLRMQVLESRTKVLGTEHADTLTSMTDLGAMYYRLGRLLESERMNVQVLEIRTRILGPEHPDTVETAKNLALVSSALERLRNEGQSQVEAGQRNESTPSA